MKKVLVWIIVMLMPIIVLSISDDFMVIRRIHGTVAKKIQPNVSTNLFSEAESQTISVITKDKNGYRVIEHTEQHWFEETWNNYRRYTYNYNADDLLCDRSMEVYQDSQWIMNYRLQYTYNQDFNITEILGEGYQNNQWVNFSLFTYSYNDEFLTERLFQYWIDSEWVNDHRFTYNYEGTNCIQESQDFWDEDEWLNYYRIFNSYDDENNIIETIDQFWETSDWVNNLKDTFTYNDVNIVQSKIRETWHDNNWFISSRILYSYDEYSNLTQELDQHWDNGWFDDSILSYVYDENQNLIERMYQSYVSGSLMNMYRYSNTFDGNNNEILSIREEWENGQWIYDKKYLYTYESFTELTELVFPEIQFSNHPNPFNPSTTISFSIEPHQQNKQIELEIYNIKGQKVKTLKCINRVDTKATESLSYSVIWNGKDDNGKAVASGIYFYQLKIDDEVVAGRKCLLLK